MTSNIKKFYSFSGNYSTITNYTNKTGVSTIYSNSISFRVPSTTEQEDGLEGYFRCFYLKDFLALEGTENLKDYIIELNRFESNDFFSDTNDTDNLVFLRNDGKIILARNQVGSTKKAFLVIDIRKIINEKEVDKANINKFLYLTENYGGINKAFYNIKYKGQADNGLFLYSVYSTTMFTKDGENYQSKFDGRSNKEIEGFSEETLNNDTIKVEKNKQGVHYIKFSHFSSPYFYPVIGYTDGDNNLIISEKGTKDGESFLFLEDENIDEFHIYLKRKNNYNTTVPYYAYVEVY